MTDKIVVLVTTGNAEEAKRIARALVEQRLAACVNLLNPVESVYRWEGKVAEDAEVLLVVKTSRALFGAVRSLVESLHSYHVPEVICLPIIDGSPNYLNWLSDSLGDEQGEAIPFPHDEKLDKPPAKPAKKRSDKSKEKPASRRKRGRRENNK